MTPSPAQGRRGGREDASRFLTCLDPTATSWTFQCFDDDQDRKSSKLVRVLHGTLDRHFDELQDLNQRGAGVYVTVNPTDGKGRKAQNITGCRAVFADLDGAPLGPV